MRAQHYYRSLWHEQIAIGPIRRAHVEAAKRLLAETRASLSEIAKQSGFTNAALLNAAFQRELGTYRRRVLKEASDSDG